jgi:hypothetical protein
MEAIHQAAKEAFSYGTTQPDKNVPRPIFSVEEMSDAPHYEDPDDQPVETHSRRFPRCFALNRDAAQQLCDPNCQISQPVHNRRQASCIKH